MTTEPAKPPAAKKPNGGFLWTPAQWDRLAELVRPVDPEVAARYRGVAEMIRRVLKETDTERSARLYRWAKIMWEVREAGRAH